MSKGVTAPTPCPGPIRLGPQYILYCDGCDKRDVDDDWSEAAHANAEYACLKATDGRCVVKAHAGRDCKTPTTTEAA